MILRGVRIGEHPESAGGYADIWKASLGSQEICVKVMRVFQSSDIDKLLKVSRISGGYLIGHQLKINPGVLIGGSHMATIESPKCSAILRRGSCGRRFGATWSGFTVDEQWQHRSFLEVSARHSRRSFGKHISNALFDNALIVGFRYWTSLKV